MRERRARKNGERRMERERESERGRDGVLMGGCEMAWVDRQSDGSETGETVDADLETAW